MSQPDDLLARIRQKVTAKELPREDCEVTWYGLGRGHPCAACDQPIATTDAEVECDLPRGGTIRLHRDCYDLWSREGRLVAPP